LQKEKEIFWLVKRKIAFFFFWRISNGNNKTKSFNLSALNIPEEQYTILGKLFTQDFLCTSIHLNDCNLSSEGTEKIFREKFVYKIFIKALQAFLHGLEKNTTCKTLELKVDEERIVFFICIKFVFII
jgi:hypothetical protein